MNRRHFLNTVISSSAALAASTPTKADPATAPANPVGPALEIKGKKTILHGRGIVGGKGEGSAIVLKKGFAVCGIDGVVAKFGVKGELQKGFVPAELVGVSVKGRVLVFAYGTGSTSGGSCLYRTYKAGYAPAGMINKKLEPITAAGAMVANVPLVIGLDQDPCELIETGDYVSVDGDKGIVEVTKRG